MSRLTGPAIQALEDMRSPLDGSFLREHNVTSDECFDLANELAAGLRLLRVIKARVGRDSMEGSVAASYLVEALIEEEPA
jgi:hypothetical protein